MHKCERCGKRIGVKDAHFLTYSKKNELKKKGDVVLCDKCNDFYKNRGIADTRKFTAKEVRKLANKVYDYRDLKGKARLELTDNDKDFVDCQATHDVRRMLVQFAEILEGKKIA